MLKEAVSSLSRWVGLSHAEESLQVQEDERRVWIRYRSNANATCQPAVPPDSEPIVAKIRDISRGGINLLVNRWFESGMLLSIRLPASNGQDTSTVLAYVVRATAQNDGEWILGCTFATELDDADLESLGVPRVRPETPDQRSFERFSCDVRATYQVVRSDFPNPQEATVLDVSPMGVGLLIQEALEVGTLLNVELRGAKSAVALVMLASIVRVTTRTGGDSVIGCNFIRELTHKEMKALL